MVFLLVATQKPAVTSSYEQYSHVLQHSTPTRCNDGKHARTCVMQGSQHDVRSKSPPRRRCVARRVNRELNVLKVLSCHQDFSGVPAAAKQHLHLRLRGSSYGAAKRTVESCMQAKRQRGRMKNVPETMNADATMTALVSHGRDAAQRMLSLKCNRYLKYRLVCTCRHIEAPFVWTNTFGGEPPDKAHSTSSGLDMLQPTVGRRQGQWLHNGHQVEVTTIHLSMQPSLRAMLLALSPAVCESLPTATA